MDQYKIVFRYQNNAKTPFSEVKMFDSQYDKTVRRHNLLSFILLLPGYIHIYISTWEANTVQWQKEN